MTSTSSATSDQPSLREAAARYQDRGWHLVALYSATDQKCSCPRGLNCRTSGKHPVKQWANDAEFMSSADLWAHFEELGRNIGIRTGAISGIWVLDIDGPEGESTLDALTAEHGTEWTETLQFRTGSGGRHLVFSWDPEFPVSCSTGSIGDISTPKIDIRGDGGYIVAPPSRSSKGLYSVLRDAPILPGPSFALEAFARYKRPVGPAAASSGDVPAGTYIQSDYDDEIQWCVKIFDTVATLPEGQVSSHRDHALNGLSWEHPTVVGAYRRLAEITKAIGTELDLAEYLPRWPREFQRYMRDKVRIHTRSAEPRPVPDFRDLDFVPETELATEKAAGGFPEPSSDDWDDWDGEIPEYPGEDLDEHPTVLESDNGYFFLYPETVASLAGPGGCGKSWFGAFLIAQVITRGGKALLVDVEQSQRVIVKRLMALGVPFEKIQAGLRVVSPGHDPLATEKSRASWQRQKEAGYDVVVIDSVARMMSLRAADENFAKDVNAWMAMVRDLAQHGPAVLMIDHVTKPSDKDSPESRNYAAGSVGKFNQVDVQYRADSLRKGRQGGLTQLRVSLKKDRHGGVAFEEATLTIDDTSDHMVATLVVDPPESKTDEQAKAANRNDNVLDARVANLIIDELEVREPEPITGSDLENKCISSKTAPRNSVRRTLKILVSRGVVDQIPGRGRSLLNTLNPQWRTKAAELGILPPMATVFDINGETNPFEQEEQAA